MEGNRKQGKTINPILVLFTVLVLCAVTTWFVSPGAFDRTEMNGRTIVVPGSFHAVDQTPVNLFDVFRSIPYGLEGAAGMMFLVMIVGGAIEIYSRTGAIDLGISRILKLSNKVGSQWILVIIMFIFSAIGGLLGWSEQIIPFVSIIVSLCLALGYDSLVGMSVCAFVCMIGFSVSPTNMYTVAIAHEIAELPMFSGMGFRLIILVVLEVVCWTYILRYAAKVKKNPEKSLMKEIDVSSLKKDFSSYEEKKMKPAQILALLTLAVSFSIAIFGLLKLGWGVNELAAAFLMGGIISGIINRISALGIINALIDGAKGNFAGALIIGIARSVQWVLTEGGLIDPTINVLSNALNGLSPTVTVIGIFIAITLFNGLIASGSGKAMAIMPMLIPLADMVGITRQTAILAFQFGDGISNTFWFTNGTMLIFFALAKIPLSKWYKFIVPLEIVLCLLSVVFMMIAVKINYGPF